MQVQCPDLYDPWHYAQPSTLARNAGVAVAIAGARTVVGLLYEYTESAGIPDKSDRAVLQNRFNRIVNETLANVPRGLVFAVVRDFVIRSLRSTLQTAAVYFASAPLCRSLTTSVSAELKRVQNTPEADRPSFGRVVKTSALALVTTHASILIVDTSLDVFRAFVAATRNGGGGGGGYSIDHDHDHDDHDDDDDDLGVLDGDLDESPPDPRRRVAVRERMASATLRRVLVLAASLLAQSVIVGIASRTKFSATWARAPVQLLAL